MADIKLPNGKIVRNVPDDMSREDFMNWAVQKGVANLGDFGPRGPNIKAREREAIQGVVDKMGPGEKFDVGYVSTVDRALGRLAGVAGKVIPGDDPLDRFSAGAKRREELTNQIGGFAGNAGKVMPALMTAPIGGASVAGQAATGAAVGGLTADDPLTGAAVGGAASLAGSGLGKLGSKAVNSMRANWADRVVRGASEEAEQVRRLSELGFKLQPGQASGGAGRRMADSVFEKSPILGSAHQSIRRQNTHRLTDLARRTVDLEPGQNVAEIGQRSLAAAGNNIDETFEAVATSVPAIPYNSKLILERAKDFIPAKQLRQIAQSGSLSGRDYMNLRSSLSKTIRATGTDPTTRTNAINFLDDLDDALDAVAPADFRRAYGIAREKYKNWLILNTDGVLKGGHVDISRANAQANKIYGDTYKMGQYANRQPRLSETRDFLDALSALNTPRMTGKDANLVQAAVNISIPSTIGAAGGWITAEEGATPLEKLQRAGLGGLLGAGLGYAGPRVGMAQPSAPATMVGGGLGRLAPLAVE